MSRIPKLPHLKICRDAYGEQEPIDQVIDWLQHNRSDLIDSLAENEVRTRDHPHYLRDGDLIIDSVVTEAANEVPVPSTRLARLHLIHEIGRRIRTVSNVPDFEMHGESHVFKGLEHLSAAIPEAKLKHIQNPSLVLRIMNYIYQFNGHIAIELYEEHRREIYTSEITQEYGRVVENIVPKALDILVDQHLAQQVFIALSSQLRELLVYGGSKQAG